jgi:hypothetical protein
MSTRYDRDLDAHRHTASVEDALFLMSPQGGALTIEQAARRLGLTEAALEKRLRSNATVGG